ncbi:hypothetical protein EOD42_23220 [Rhodovarius crocodyli]|uniref:Uncharacterized protein n=1 Tax=Rhodovarius crocodyli TaxID=1979269 RepID=A0A437LZC2_9PROT|nr:hypothetical protein [Rhodovarius crocodyli]RVT90715.1 hypothetical protein EOD42_23220 [Rhodovarius crocodyli]
MSDTFTSLYLQDPATAIRMRQLQAAQRLRQEGSSSAPLQHWTQGLNRILQSFVGAQDERAALDAMRQDQQQQRSEADTFMRGLMGGGNVQQLVAAAQQPAPQAVSPAPGEPQQPAPTVPPRANFTVPGGDIYGGRGGPALAARDGALGAGPTQLAALSAGRASDIGQPLNNPAVTGPNSELPGWDAGLGAPTGRINPMVGGNPGASSGAPSGAAQGLLTPGNIDLSRRPRVQNPDGSISTVASIGVNIDGREVLLPTISDDGRRLSEAEAIEQFRRTGRHLGMFDTPRNATAYAERLHDAQAARYVGPGPTPAAPAAAAAPATASGASMMSAALRALNSPNQYIRSQAPALLQLAQRQMDDERRAQERRDDRGYRVEDRNFAAQQAREQARYTAELALANRPPMAVGPGTVLVDPRTNQPVYTAPRETFGGSGVEADAIRLLMAPNADNGSPAYGIAYQRLYGPRQVQQPDGTIVIMTPQPPPGIRMPAGMQAPGAPSPQAAAPQQQPPVAQVDPGSPTIAGPAPGLVASPPQMPGQQPTTTQTPAGAVTRIPGRGTPLSDGAINSLSEQGGILSQWRALGETFNPDFGGYGSGLVGRAANTIARNTPGASPRADWWQQFDSLDNVVRNQLFGSALTNTERAAWEATTVSPGSSPETIRANLARRQQIVRDAITRQARARLANGANPQAVSEATGIPLETLMAPQPAPGTGGAAPGTSGWGIRPVER